MRSGRVKSSGFLALVVLPLALACHDEGPVGVDELAPPNMVVRPAEVVLALGDVFKLEAYILDGEDEILVRELELEWNSDDMGVIEALGEGWIRALGPGETEVVADYRKYTASARVKVTGDGPGEH